MKLGVPELLIILAVIVLLFGPTQIPRLTKMIGKGVKNFRSGMSDEDKDDDSEDDEKKSEKKSDKKSAKKSKKADKDADEEE
ncbi:MAG: twin-arginine translocase TatA/TatE family subunit [Lachnospiraceae bacterium]|nr:twin-arginine translocase TatA/TatE family subunit [Lachnospiraceae bacterium]